MRQQFTFADSEFSSKRRQIRKEIFLSRMDKLLQWYSPGDEAMEDALYKIQYASLHNCHWISPFQILFTYVGLRGL